MKNLTFAFLCALCVSAFIGTASAQFATNVPDSITPGGTFGTNAPGTVTNTPSFNTNPPAALPVAASIWGGTNNPNGLYTGAQGSQYVQFDATGTNYVQSWVKQTGTGATNWVLEIRPNPNFTNASGTFSGTFAGNGGGLTNLNAGGMVSSSNTNIFPTLTVIGDSLSGYGGSGTPTVPWPTPLTNSFMPYITISNFAQGGTYYIAWYTNNAYVTNGSSMSYSNSHQPNIFAPWYGHNDEKDLMGLNTPLGIYDTNLFFLIYSNGLHRAQTNGSTVLAFTLTGDTGWIGTGKQTTNAVINSWIRLNWTNFANALIDADALFPITSLSTNTIDGIHLTVYCEAVLATNIYNVCFVTNHFNAFDVLNSATQPNLSKAYGQLQYRNLPANFTIAGPGSGVLLGNGASIGGGGEIALGASVQAASYSIGIGASATANGQRNVALGFLAQNSGNDSVIIGDKIQSNPGNGSVILAPGDNVTVNAGSMVANYTNTLELGTGAANVQGMAHIYGNPYFQVGGAALWLTNQPTGWPAPRQGMVFEVNSNSVIYGVSFTKTNLLLDLR